MTDTGGGDAYVMLQQRRVYEEGFRSTPGGPRCDRSILVYNPRFLWGDPFQSPLFEKFTNLKGFSRF